MATTTTTTHRYLITVTGEGGEFTSLRMSPEQVTFWNKRGGEALAQELSERWVMEGDECPPPPKFENYDIEQCVTGIEPSADLTIVVEDEKELFCFEASGSDSRLLNCAKIEKSIEAPANGAFYRTFERCSLRAEVQVTDPFDPSELELLAVHTPQGVVIETIRYCGEDLVSRVEVDQTTVCDALIVITQLGHKPNRVTTKHREEEMAAIQMYLLSQDNL